MKLKYNVPSEFLKEETRRDYTISEGMKKAWAVQLDLLQELMRICNEHGLHVYADSGTLIGAIREKGFIPWDDDIDVAMLREDYDKLMELADEFKEPYVLQSMYSHPNYPNRYAQLHMAGTSAIRKGSHDNHLQGIFIDIFVLDTMPSSPRAFKRHYKKVSKAKLKLKIVRKITDRMPSSLALWCRNNTKILSDKYWFGRYEDVVRSVKRDEKSAYSAFVCQNMTLPIKNLSCYNETIMMPYEHIMIPVPSGYDELLRMEYGDYMRPVKAPTMHGTLDFDTSAIEF